MPAKAAVFLAVLAGSAAAAALERPGRAATPRSGASAAAPSFAACVGGFAGAYPCKDVDLLSLVPLAAMDCGAGNDVWGWTDPATGREYALMGCDNGISFVDVSDPVAPVYVGRLPTYTVNSPWRSVKTAGDHALVVSEAAGHGLQVFDLRGLRAFSGTPIVFSETAHYAGFSDAHNVAANETSGFAYAVGTDTCAGGLHMIDARNPASPQAAGCFAADGYTHDAQCVVYAGPDEPFRGREVCFASNEDTLTVVDVENKSEPSLLSRTGYAGSGYAHQGWLTEDHGYFLLDDELDERTFGHGTRTWIWDVSNLAAPVVLGAYTSSSPAIDHNLYVRDGYAYEANYRSGLRIIDLAGIATASLAEAAFFDVYPADDARFFNGAWSAYPFFPSGVVVVSGIEQGLFVLKPNLPPPPAASFYTLAPCRVADTRDAAGVFGGPAVAAGRVRLFPVAGRCGVPPGAKAVAVNVTVTQPASAGHLSISSPYAFSPNASTLNYRAGQTRANNAIVSLGAGGEIRVFCAQPSGGVHVIVDVSGYFR